MSIVLLKQINVILLTLVQCKINANQDEQKKIYLKLLNFRFFFFFLFCCMNRGFE